MKSVLVFKSSLSWKTRICIYIKMYRTTSLKNMCAILNEVYASFAGAHAILLWMDAYDPYSSERMARTQKLNGLVVLLVL